MEFKCEIETCGDGYWSDVQKTVQVTDLKIAYVNEEADFGELRVYFDTTSWNVDEDGLIYTDSQFIERLRMMLNLIGLAGEDVSYSEQGMQGDNYVSLDVGEEFLSSWRDMKTVIITD